MEHWFAPWVQKQKVMIHHYSFLIGNNKLEYTRYFVNHCIIYDRDTNLCYHLSNPEGYICEPLEELMNRYDIVDCEDFDSEKDIEWYFEEHKAAYGGYDLLDNNCEDFANGFYGSAHSTQTTYMLGGLAAVCAVYCGLLM